MPDIKCPQVREEEGESDSVMIKRFHLTWPRSPQWPATPLRVPATGVCGRGAHGRDRGSAHGRDPHAAQRDGGLGVPVTLCFTLCCCRSSEGAHLHQRTKAEAQAEEGKGRSFTRLSSSFSSVTHTGKPHSSWFTATLSEKNHESLSCATT